MAIFESNDPLVRYDVSLVMAKTRRWVLQLVDQLIAYEEGQITQEEEIALFQLLIDTGTCWQLDGHYQCVGATLIEAGLIKSPELAKAHR
jgi:hypothetical protein